LDILHDLRGRCLSPLCDYCGASFEFGSAFCIRFFKKKTITKMAMKMMKAAKAMKAMKSMKKMKAMKK